MNNDRAILKFIVFCLEHYKFSKQISALQALADFKNHDVFSYLTNGYEVLHTQGKNYLMNDIQEFINHHSSK